MAMETVYRFQSSLCVSLSHYRSWFFSLLLCLRHEEYAIFRVLGCYIGATRQLRTSIA